MGPVGFLFPVQLYSVAWEKEQGKGPHTAAALISDSYSAAAAPAL